MEPWEAVNTLFAELRQHFEQPAQVVVLEEYRKKYRKWEGKPHEKTHSAL